MSESLFHFYCIPGVQVSMQFITFSLLYLPHIICPINYCILLSPINCIVKSRFETIVCHLLFRAAISHKLLLFWRILQEL